MASPASPKFQGFTDQLSIVNENRETVFFSIHGSTDRGAVVVKVRIEETYFNPL